MRTVGLIVEYNPFHNGHLYHLQKSKELTDSDAVVAVMSGNFLQRGEPALLDKWARTEMALAGGCDLVIELPVAYATHAAEWFAYGAISLLEASGVVDSFCFGTESGQLAPLQLAASIIANEPDAFKQLLYDQLHTGTSYPVAYSAAIKQYLRQLGHEKEADFPFDMPNHTLGLHYLSALSRINGTMKPFTIAREKAQYHDQSAKDCHIASATAIRKAIFDQQELTAIRSLVPDSTYDIIYKQWSSKQGPLNWESFYIPLMHQILTTTPQALSNIHEVTEGLEHRIHQTLQTHPVSSVESLLHKLKTKRYTRTKLQRALLALLLSHSKQDFSAAQLASGIQYIRVLGFTGKGRHLLKRMKKTAALPVIMSASRTDSTWHFLDLDIRASHVYELGKPASAQSIQLYRDFREKPIIMP